MMPRGAAALCFHMSLRQVDQLPIVRIIPGWYCVGSITIHQKKPQKVVCVGSAKQLALASHGSETRMTELAKGKRQLSHRTQLHYGHYRAAQLQPYDTDPILIPSKRNPMDDPFPGIASITFPSTASSVVEHGLWCLGCDWIFRNYCSLDPSVQSRLMPNCLGSAGTLRNLAFRERSRKNFLRHVQKCYGVRQIAAKAGLDEWLQGIAHVTIDQWT